MNINGEDDITVLSPEEKDDHYNVHGTFMENDFPLFLGAKPDNNTHQSLHVLQRAYNDLKRRYNDTTQKNDIMSRALKDIETQRIHQVKQYSLFNGPGAANAAGTEASGSSGASDNSADAQLRAQLGYADSLQRQIMRMNEREKEMERKYLDLYTKYKRLEDDYTKLQEKNRKLVSEIQALQAEFNKDISSKDLVIKQKDNEIEELNNLNKNMMDRCNILEQRLVRTPGMDSLTSPLTLKQERHIITMIEEQNKFLKELKQRMHEQDTVIKKQNTLIKELTSKRNSVASLPRGGDTSLSRTKERSHPHQLPVTSRPVQQQCSEPHHPQDIHDPSNYTLMAPSDDLLGLTLPSESQFATTMRQGGAIPKFPLSQRIGVEGDTFDTSDKQGPKSPRRSTQQESRRSRSEPSQVTVPDSSKDATIVRPTKLTSPLDMQPIYLPPSSPRPQPADMFVDPQQVRHQNVRQIDNDSTLLKMEGHRVDVPSSLDQRLPAGLTKLNETGSKPPSHADNGRVPQQNVDHVNVPVHAESDYVNLKDVKHGASSNNTPQVCPVCNKTFKNMPLQEFQLHVFDCVDENDSEAEYMVVPSPQTKSSGNKECPMCGAAFPVELPQEEFERHVQEHFGEEPIEILSP